MSKKEFSVTANGTVPPSDGRASDAPPSAPRATAEEAEALLAGLKHAGRYFVHDEGPEPLVVEHATGEPKYRVQGGKLVAIKGE